MSVLLLVAATSTMQCNPSRSGQEQRQCTGQLAESVERKLNAQWELAAAALKREDRENQAEKRNVPNMFAGLLASQRAWLTYRKDHCNMVGDQWAGGTGHSELESLCRIDLTQQRIRDLKLRGEQKLMPKRDHHVH